MSNPKPKAVVTKALLGMSAPAGDWATRVSEVGPGLQARRIFLSSFTASTTLVATAGKAGTTPVVSCKEGGYTWADIAAGKADADIKAMGKKLAALNTNIFVAAHHEPASGAEDHLAGENGSAAQYAAAMTHALPLLKSAKVKAGCIGNGWWFNTKGGLSDAERAVWFSPALRSVADFLAADTYCGTLGAEDIAPKIVNMGAWAKRVGYTGGLGLGEFNTQSAKGITDGLAALKANPQFVFGNLWNANGTGAAHAKVLTGAMLTAFKTGLANW